MWSGEGGAVCGRQEQDTGKSNAISHAQKIVGLRRVATKYCSLVQTLKHHNFAWTVARYQGNVQTLAKHHDLVLALTRYCGLVRALERQHNLI